MPQNEVLVYVREMSLGRIPFDKLEFPFEVHISILMTHVFRS